MQRTPNPDAVWTENQSGSSWPYLAMMEALLCARPWASSFAYIISSHPGVLDPQFDSAQIENIWERNFLDPREYTLMFHVTALQTIDHNNYFHCIYIVFGIITNLDMLCNTHDSCVLL